MGWFKRNKKKKNEDTPPRQEVVQASEEVIQASELEVSDNCEQTVAMDVSLYKSKKKKWKHLLISGRNADQALLIV